MKSLQPIFDLLREPFLRFRARTLCPLAPAEMHLKTALALADIARRTS